MNKLSDSLAQIKLNLSVPLDFELCLVATFGLSIVCVSLYALRSIEEKAASRERMVAQAMKSDPLLDFDVVSFQQTF